MIEVPFLPNNLVIKNTKTGYAHPMLGYYHHIKGNKFISELRQEALVKLTLKGLTPFLSKMHFFANFSLYVAIPFKPKNLLHILLYYLGSL